MKRVKAPKSTARKRLTKPKTKSQHPYSKAMRRVGKNRPKIGK
jgi:hypothetical protein